MSDYLVRGMSMDGFVKVAAICSTELVRRGAQIQKTTPNATAAFGRALTAASMMDRAAEAEKLGLNQRHSTLEKLAALAGTKEKCDAPECSPIGCRKARDAHEL
mgnify:CR=1 FL=1